MNYTRIRRPNKIIRGLFLSLPQIYLDIDIGMDIDVRIAVIT